MPDEPFYRLEHSIFDAPGIVPTPPIKNCLHLNALACILRSMKGVSFQNGVEFKITIEGESWAQGSLIQGKIESKPGAKAQVILAEGTDKKVKLKSPDAFVVLEEATIAYAPYEWKFQLPVDARVSDKSGALYVLYGHGENLEKLGQLRLNIIPHQHTKDLIDLLTSHFRFAFKSVAAGKKQTTEVKLDPPGNKDWSMLEQLVLFVRINNDTPGEETMDVKFQFHRQEVDALKGGLATKSVKREIDRSWNLAQIILSFNGRLDKDIITAEIDKLIAEYRDAGWLSS